MICGHVETCEFTGHCIHRKKHAEYPLCTSPVCPHRDNENVLCIPYIDPILKRVQERFNEEISGLFFEYRDAQEILARIIAEESEK